MKRERKLEARAGPQAPTSARASPWLGLSLVLIAFALFAGALEDTFVFDGVLLVQQNPLLTPFEPLRIAGLDWWEGTGKPGGLFRPVSLVSLAALRGLGGGGPEWINFANVALHGFVAWLHFALLLRFLGPRRGAQPIAWIAALIALVHPLCAEVLGGQVGLADLLASFWMCAAVLVASGKSHARFACGALLAALAALSKESGVLVVPLAILFEALRQDARSDAKRRVVRALAWSGLGVAAALCCRYGAIGSLASVDDPVYAGFSLPARVASALSTFATHSLPLLFVPWRQLAVVSHQDTWPAEGFDDPRAIAGALLVLALFVAPWFALRRGRRDIAFGAWFFLAAWLPTSNLFFSSGAIAASRFFYAGLIGLALPLAVTIVDAWQREKLERVVAGVLATWFVAVLSVVAWRETSTWQSPRELLEAQHLRAPTSVYVLLDLGEEIRGEDSVRAMQLFDIAAQASVPSIPGREVPPEDLLETLYLARISAAHIAAETSTRERAEENYRAAELLARRGQKARAAVPFRGDWNRNRLVALQPLAELTLQRAKTLTGAEQARVLDSVQRDLDASDACDPDSSETVRLRSMLLQARGDTEGRGRLVEAAWKKRPEDPLLRVLWATELRQRGRQTEALGIELDVAATLFDSFDHVRSLAIAKQGLASADSAVAANSLALLERLARSNSGRAEWREASIEAAQILRANSSSRD